RDEGLRSADDVLVAVAHGGRLQRGDVGTRPRLRQPERAENRRFDERWKPLRLLLVAPEQDHRPRAEPVRGGRRADARAAPVELLADEHAVEGRECGAAVLLRHVQVHEPELVRLRDHVGRMPHVLVACVLERPDLVRRELARELPQRLLLLREAERDARALLDADHRRLLYRLTSQSIVLGSSAATPGDRRLRATPPTRTSAKAATRRPPRTPPGRASEKRTVPAAIGRAFVQSTARPADESRLPRWNASWRQTNARP